MARLVLLHPAGADTEFGLPVHPIVVGRGADCAIRIDRKSMSRHHARIYNSGDGWCVEDLNSTNGSYVNEILVVKALRHDADFLTIGGVVFKFDLLGGSCPHGDPDGGATPAAAYLQPPRPKLPVVIAWRTPLATLAACWSASPDHVTVTFAHEADTVHFAGDHCQLQGAPAPELREPILAFARSNLIRDIDQLTGYSSVELGIETPTNQVGCDHPQHRDGYFAEIIVTPRANFGELVVTQRQLLHGQCAWGAHVVYCLHVSPSAEGRTVVVEKLTSLIGQATSRGH